ncbi:hypothetical protein ACQU0X_28680 [Pseudovibrio ascidiaceicola]|uniref:hypothetical protein n=1 Tax=Pseudovibrio ascidiaceicola TaxID=285279 RepID=UPI003D36941F
MSVTAHYGIQKVDETGNLSVGVDYVTINAGFVKIDGLLKDLNDVVGAKAPANHQHTIDNITGLQEVLDGKLGTGAEFSLNDLTDVQVSGAQQGAVLVKLAQGWGVSNNFATKQEVLDAVKDKADTASNTTFQKIVSFIKDIVLNGNAIIASDSSGAFSDRSGTNIDHIYHDKGANSWHFVSNRPYKARGNSKLTAGSIDLLETTGSAVTGDVWGARIVGYSQNMEDIPATRSASGLVIENRYQPPDNASEATNRRFAKRALYSMCYLDSGSSGKPYESFGGLIGARLRGDISTRSMGGVYSQGFTESGSTGDVSYLYGGRAYTAVNGSGYVGVQVGWHIGVNPNADHSTISHCRGIYTHMDYDAGTIVEDPIALYQNYDGDWDGKKRVGIVQEGVDENRLTGVTRVNGIEVATKDDIGVLSPFATVWLPTTGTWNKPSGYDYFSFDLRGGDGGIRSGKSPGGAGGIVRLLVKASEVPSQLAIVEGAAGKNSSSSNSTRNGGDTTVKGGSLNLIAGGGVKHSNNGADTGAGGTASGGDDNLPGAAHGGWAAPRTGDVQIRGYILK